MQQLSGFRQTQDRRQCLLLVKFTCARFTYLPLFMLFCWQQKKNTLKLHFGTITLVWLGTSKAPYLKLRWDRIISLAQGKSGLFATLRKNRKSALVIDICEINQYWMFYTKCCHYKLIPWNYQIHCVKRLYYLCCCDKAPENQTIQIYLLLCSKEGFCDLLLNCIVQMCCPKLLELP